MWPTLLCFTPSGEQKWSTATSFTGEDRVSPHAIGQLKQKQGERGQRSVIVLLTTTEKSLSRSGKEVPVTRSCFDALMDCSGPWWNIESRVNFRRFVFF